jgi:hypothetical protein
LKKQTTLIKTTAYERVVHPAGLGLCEHCGTLMTIADMPSEAMDAEWRCSKCKGILSNKTFGYEEVNGEWKKTKWVGKNGKWSAEKPEGNFDLGRWLVSDKTPIF